VYLKSYVGRVKLGDLEVKKRIDIFWFEFLLKSTT